MHGIIFATKKINNGDSGLTALLRIGGITLLERHAKMMAKIGIRKILIAAMEKNGEILKEVRNLNAMNLNIDIVTPEENGEKGLFFNFNIYKKKEFIITEGSMLFDSRLLKILYGTDEEKICVIPGKHVTCNKKGAFIFAGCARLSKKTIEVFKLHDPCRWLKNLHNILNTDANKILDLSLENTYDVDMRRDIPFLVFQIRYSEDKKAAKRLLIEAAQKKVLDWPAWFIHRPIENWIIYRICELPVTPNQITILNVITGLVCSYLFASGQIRIGLILALIAGILDGLDGKQARIKFMTSQLGEIEHTLDKINENLWYCAMAYYLYVQGYGIYPWILFAAIFISNMLHVVINDVFRKKFTVQFDDYGSFERRFRSISGRQNTYLWTLFPFVFF